MAAFTIYLLGFGISRYKTVLYNKLYSHVLKVHLLCSHVCMSVTCSFIPVTVAPTPSPMFFMTFSPSSSPTSIGAPGTCGNGLVGVAGYGQCCVLECGHCYEYGCRTRAKSAGLTADDCCPRGISEAGLDCKIAGSAPCTLHNS